MEHSPAPEFDRYAKDYGDLLKGSIPGSLYENEYFAQYKIDYVGARVGVAEPTRLLDFGCGVGRSLALLQRRFPRSELHGFDVSAQSLDLAREQVSTARLTDDVGALPAQAFDLVFVANVMHHIPLDERPGTMTLLRSLLTDEGRLFIFEHNPYNPATRIVFERCPFDEDASMLKRRETVALAEGAGLRLDRARYTLFFPKPLSFLRPVEQALGWLPLGAQYCAEFRR